MPRRAVTGRWCLGCTIRQLAERHIVRSLTKHWNCQHSQGLTERFLNLQKTRRVS
jgi:hypothetical protein